MCQHALGSQTWSVGPLDPRAEPRVVHVWRIRLDLERGVEGALMRVLSDAEQARASRFRFDRHRRRFVVGRARVRQLLGRYTGVHPAALKFTYGKHGKPHLSVGSVGQDIRFNFSNSEDLALLAVTLGADVGVDLEFLKAMPQCLGIAGRFFTKREAETLRTLPEAIRVPAFFRCWTMKEAFLKSTGEGLHFDLDRVEVTADPRLPAALCSVDGDTEAGSRWFIQVLEPAKGYAGALVVDGAVDRVETWSLA